VTDERKRTYAAFQRRRQRIAMELRQLQADVDSYNRNANPGAPIGIVLDLTRDGLELAATAKEEREDG